MNTYSIFILRLNLLFGLVVVCLLLSFTVDASELLYTKQPSVTPLFANPGNFDVGVSTIRVTNPQQLSAPGFTAVQDRNLTLEVWYPASIKSETPLTSYKNVTRSGKQFELSAMAYRNAAPLGDSPAFPLIVISHGYTGYRTILFYLAEHLASHGYVVAGIDHSDSTNAEIDFERAPSAGFLSTLMNRARDQQFVLDYFAGQNTTLSKIINTDQAAVIGYSMGGYGAINTVGGCYDFTASILQQYGLPAAGALSLLAKFNICNAGRESVDPRWKGMIAIAPWGGETGVHSEDSLAAIKVPSLYVAGDQDDVSGYQNGVKKLFEDTGVSAKYLMVYDNARHNIAAHPAPDVAWSNELDLGHYFEPSWNVEILNRINKHMSLVFLNCHLQGDKSACQTLPTSEDIGQTRQADGTMSPAWPGFKDRWGTGVKFFRE